MYKSIDNIRQEFLDFFKTKHHEIIPSSSLIPENDPTLLFSNSGMNQFKNIFLGLEQPLFKRVATIQRCMRAGGKHNDLDHIGYTDRHLTFFEMLGNFSFGDYFKIDAIQFAWDLLTNNNWFNLSKDKIWVTTHICDDESYKIWKNHIGLPNQRIVKIGSKSNNISDSDNFWQMGNIGPCGVCSEIFYDRGCNFQGTPPNNTKFIGNRYIEIWNLVFIQFNRQINGKFSELPMLSVDTGMGLERITAVLQKVSSNYAIDVFRKLITSISQVMKINQPVAKRSLYVIVDHIRACVFLIKDGVIPSNEGRGYVLRRVIRRAICHGQKIGMNDIFFYKLVKPLINHMRYISDISHYYRDIIEQVLFNEEKLFASTLQRGLELLQTELIRLKDHKTLSGDFVFRLYTTYGFPIELTKDICYERNIEIDLKLFDQLMLREQHLSKQSNRFFTIPNNVLLDSTVNKSIFVGYRYLSFQSKVLKLLQNNKLVRTIYANQKAAIVLDITPFYGRSGGQIGDIGYLKTKGAVFQVIDTKNYGSIIVHEGLVNQGTIKIGDYIFAEVNKLKRHKICLNHSATHLLHESLLRVLGRYVTQQGSLVNDEYLRFDFSHHNALTEKEMNKVEYLVNQQIWNNLPITDEMISIESVKNSEIKVLTHKQYENTVRVLRIGNFSAELCGGTHAKCTKEIGLFIITKEIGIGSGVRRIEAVTEKTALSVIQRKKNLTKGITQIMHSDDTTVLNKIHELKVWCNELKKEVKYLKNTQELQNSLSFIKEIHYIKDIPVLIKRFNNTEKKSLYDIIGHLKSHLKSGIFIFINIKNNDICYIVISITHDLLKKYRLDALDLINNLINSFGGQGKGKSNLAQAEINKILIESEIMIKIQTLLSKIL